MATMANHWAARDWSVTLVTLDGATDDFYALHPAVERVALGVSGVSPNVWRAVRSNARRVMRLRRAIRGSRPDVVISFMAATNALTLLAARAERVPVVVSERVDPTQYQLGRIWTRLRRVTYPWAAAVVVQTPEVLHWARGFLRPETLHVIANPVAAPPDSPRSSAGFIARESRETATAVRHVVGMGRLDSQKGFDLLVRAFAQCCARRLDWRLTIIGEGEERDRLEALAEQLGIRSLVLFPGRVTEPHAVLRDADLFVLSSRYEGFPNALLEAMAAGLPVIATDCPSGPAHIVRPGIDGLLVPVEDPDALAAAMASLMDDPACRAQMGQRAIDVLERFAVERIMADWESLLGQVTRTASFAERQASR
jgi:GalNAc-alpha-(1->4)-GalNAc-alpha-(1->3)-diNAcBac-PP-undecaprenol alpha-1,4-N-acetyl-D-galactosaminyltransferase